MTEFEKALIKEVKRIREYAKENTDWTNFDLIISVSGRTHSGEIDISFSCGEYPRVQANSFDAAVKEYEHRQGFDKRNQPLALSYEGEIIS